MAGPGDEIAPRTGGSGPFRASHADREQAIEVLKTAFVADRLTKDEFDLRVGQALASRTYAELAAVTAGLPAEPTTAQPTTAQPTTAQPTTAQSATAQPPRPARAPGEQPVLRPGPVIMVTTAFYAGLWAFTLLPPWPTDAEGDPPASIIVLLFSTTLIYLFVVAIAVGYVIAGRREKRSGGRGCTVGYAGE